MPISKLTPVALASALLLQAAAAHAQPAPAQEKTLSTVIVNSSADASAQGLSPAYPGGQVARVLVEEPQALRVVRIHRSAGGEATALIAPLHAGPPT